MEKEISQREAQILLRFHFEALQIDAAHLSARQKVKAYSKLIKTANRFLRKATNEQIKRELKETQNNE